MEKRDVPLGKCDKVRVRGRGEKFTLGKCIPKSHVLLSPRVTPVKAFVACGLQNVLTRTSSCDSVGFLELER